VLNGDTFDFKRAIYASSAETAQHATTWLRELSKRAPATSFFYVLGNHDSQTHFVRALTAALPEMPNVSLINDSLRLGSSLFLHGDVVDLPLNTDDISQVRSRYAQAEPDWGSRLFSQLVTRLRVNKIEYLRHSKRMLAERIIRHLARTQNGALDGLSDIYFGHTHVPFKDFEHQGLRFHNTGSMIRGLPWMPMGFKP
jgi:UDP-2,3-diacylglucosamine hydrolase